MERDLSPASWLDEPAVGSMVGAPGERPDPLLAALARRICGHAERQLTVAERLGGQGDEAAELRAGARRLLRDGESVLTLAGGSPERRGRIPTAVGRILADAAAGADEPDRVSVPPAPSAAVATDVAVAVGQVLCELLAHAERSVPRTGRIELAGRWAGDGGVTVEVLGEGVDLPWQEAVTLENELAGGASGPVPPERLGLHLAARLARRFGAQLELQAPLGGPTTPGYGTVALVRLPRVLVEPAGGAPPGPQSIPAVVPPAAPFLPAAAPPVSAGSDASSGSSERSVPFAASSPADDLLGPFRAGSPLHGEEDDLVGTPIYAAVASAWFRTDEDPAPRNGTAVNGAGPGRARDALTNGLVNGVNGHGTGGLADSWIGADASGSSGLSEQVDPRRSSEPSDWSSAGDAEWRAAAERAARAETELPTTASGLPQRRPGRQMVAPPLRAGAAAYEQPAEREPERVRRRLATYQAGLQAGRHRAADPDDEAPAGDGWEGLGEVAPHDRGTPAGWGGAADPAESTGWSGAAERALRSGSDVAGGEDTRAGGAGGLGGEGSGGAGLRRRGLDRERPDRERPDREQVLRDQVGRDQVAHDEGSRDANGAPPAQPPVPRSAPRSWSRTPPEGGWSSRAHTHEAGQSPVRTQAQGPVPGPTIERVEDRRDPWTGEGLWDDDPRS